MQALPTGQPAHPPAQQSLQAALHQLLDQAVDEGGDVEAMGAIAQMAAAVAEIEEEMEELAESEEEEEGEGGGAPAGAAAVPGIFQQLQQQAVAAAEDAALAHLPPHAGEAGAVAVGQPASATQQHTHRLWAGTAAGAGGVLWSLLGSGVAQWEVAHRDPACERWALGFCLPAF